MSDRNMISLKRSPVILCLFFSNIIPIADMTLSAGVKGLHTEILPGQPEQGIVNNMKPKTAQLAYLERRG